MNERDSDFIMITLAKNEELFLPECIKGIINSNMKPKLWVMVNDGSTDRTLDIMKENSNKYKYIKYITINNKTISLHEGRYSFLYNSGFNYAINYCKNNNINWEYIGSLDADTVVTEDYFLKIIKNMNEDKRLGITSGSLYDKYPDRYILTNTLDDIPRGSGRLIRKKCYYDIKGYQGSAPDSTSNIKAKIHGWKTRSFDNIFAYHLRPTYTKLDNVHRIYIYRGNFLYSMNFHPLLFLMKIIQKLITKEGYLTLWIINGYMTSYLQKKEIIEDEIVKHYYYYIRIRELLRSVFILKKMRTN